MTKATSHPQVHRVSELLRRVELNFDNKIFHSRFLHFEKDVRDSGLSIKLGHKGEEHYILDGERHTIRPGRFLIVNRHRSFHCHLRDTEPVEGFCLYLSENVLCETAASLQRSPEEQLDSPFSALGHTPAFFERVYHVEENELGRFLEQMRPWLARRQALDFDAFFYLLAEKLLRSHWQEEKQIECIGAGRRSTREELFRRLNIAHQYILDNYRQDIQLDQLAREAALSKYHLLRTYKEAYGTTPYRQVLNLRLEHARRLLARGQKLEDIAYQLGFSGRRSFTKKAFGIAPSQYRAQNEVES